MADDPNKTQGNTGNQGDEGKGQEEMVSKAEFEKIQADMKASSEKASKLESELSKAKNELLSPEYIDFIQQKTAGSRTQSKSDVSGVDLESLSRKELVEFIRNDLVGVLDEYRKTNLVPMNQSMAKLIAQEEIRRCEGLYSDFGEYREQMKNILVANDALTIEEAYHIAKNRTKTQKDFEEQRKAAEAAREKPGGPGSSSTSPKQFKSKDDAAEDAWDKVFGNKSEA